MVLAGHPTRETQTVHSIFQQVNFLLHRLRNQSMYSSAVTTSAGARCCCQACLEAAVVPTFSADDIKSVSK